MGSYIGFVMVTPGEYERALADADLAERFVYEEDREPDGSLDKAWAGLAYVLDEAGVDFDVHGGEPIGDRIDLFAWSPEAVAESAAVLTATPWEKLVPHLDAETMNEESVYPGAWEDAEDSDWLESHHRLLVAFFTEVAERRGAALSYFSN